jgi:hypothetical protein
MGKEEAKILIPSSARVAGDDKDRTAPVRKSSSVVGRVRMPCPMHYRPPLARLHACAFRTGRGWVCHLCREAGWRTTQAGQIPRRHSG